MDNPDSQRSSGRVYALEAGLGIWRGLSARVLFPLLDVTAEQGGDTDREFDIGDLSLQLGYQWIIANPEHRLALGLAAGAYFPSGGRGGTSDIPSSANFASGTVDPQVAAFASYDLEGGLGVHASGLVRIVAYESDGFRAGHTAVYGGGVHYRIGESAVPSLDIVALNRGESRTGGHTAGMDMGPGMNMGMEEEGSGGDAIYLAPGLTYRVLDGPLAGLAIGGRVQIPVYQFVNGTQLAEQFGLSLTLSYGFRVF